MSSGKRVCLRKTMMSASSVALNTVETGLGPLRAFAFIRVPVARSSPLRTQMEGADFSRHTPFAADGWTSDG